MFIAPGSTVVFTGDSITDCGRARPYGDSADDSLGNGYVALLDWILASEGTDPPLRLINTGISGNTVRDLAARWNEDVLAFEPDWVSVMIGINDVWRQFDSDPAIVKPVTLDEYTATLTHLLKQLSGLVKGVLVMKPFYLESGPGDAMRAMRDRYAQAADRVARSEGAIVVDTQAAYERVLPLRGRDRLAPDGVHPTGFGHMVLALAWLASVGATLA